MIYSLLPCLSWLLRSRIRKCRRDLRITLYIDRKISMLKFRSTYKVLLRNTTKAILHFVRSLSICLLLNLSSYISHRKEHATTFICPPAELNPPLETAPAPKKFPQNAITHSIIHLTTWRLLYYVINRQQNGGRCFGFALVAERRRLAEREQYFTGSYISRLFRE